MTPLRQEAPAGLGMIGTDDSVAAARVVELRRHAPVHRLRVIEGLHTGAEIPLEPGSNIVGSAPDCDVLLADDGVAEHHLEIVLEGSTVWIRRIDDSAVQLKGRELSSQRAILAERAVVQVGPCAFTLLRDGSSASSAAPSGVMATSAEQTSGAQPAARPRRGRPLRWIVGLALLMAVAAAALVVAWQRPWPAVSALALTREQPSAPAREASQFEAAIAQLKAPDLKLEALGPRAYRLSGHVATQDEARALTILARDAPLLTVESRVVVGSQVADWIRDSLASPQLDVAYVGQGAVAIRGEAQGEAYRARLAQVHKQFARLVRIDDRTHPPAKPAPGRAAPPPAAATGPALLQPVPVARIGPGAPAYVATDGKHRYFVGAVLPDGRVIESIAADRVVLRRPGGEPEEIRP